MKVIQFGDEIGIGAIVEKFNIMGFKRTYVLCEHSVSSLFNTWVCVETGSEEYATNTLSRLHRFYVAQYIKRDIER